MKVTEREAQVLLAIRDGAHTIPDVAKALQPPVTPRGAERLVHQLADKLPRELSQRPFIRIIRWIERQPDALERVLRPTA